MRARPGPGGCRLIGGRLKTQVGDTVPWQNRTVTNRTLKKNNKNTWPKLQWGYLIETLFYLFIYLCNLYVTLFSNVLIRETSIPGLFQFLNNQQENITVMLLYLSAVHSLIESWRNLKSALNPRYPATNNKQNIPGFLFSIDCFMR